MNFKLFFIRLSAIFLLVLFLLSYGIISFNYFKFAINDFFNTLNIALGIWIVISFVICGAVVKYVLFNVWSNHQVVNNISNK